MAVLVPAPRLVVWRTRWQPGIEFLRRYNKIIPAAEAVPRLSPGLRRMQRLAAIESYLKLDTTPDASGGRVTPPRPPE